MIFCNTRTERNMSLMQKKAYLGRAALVCAPIIWGASFVLVKDLTSVIGVGALLAVRFLSAAVLLSLIYFRRLRKINRGYLLRGAAIGALLYFSYALQTYGIRYTTPGKNAFLTGVYVVLVPFVYWLAARKRPTFFNITAAAMSIVGIGLVCLSSSLSRINIGDVLTLLGGVMFAFHIVCVSEFTEKHDPILLTILQFFFSGLLGVAEYLITGQGLLAAPGTGDLFAILYLAVMCTAVALLFQNIGQKYTPPALTSVILCTESALGFLFSAVMGRETLTAKLIIGCLLIFIATLTCELRIPVLAKEKSHEEIPR